MKRQLDTHLNYSKLMLASNFVVSLGIILVTSGGSWDITNHILNKPETFFAPPHAVLYSGVGIALSGFAALFLSWIKSSRPQNFKKGVTICGIGISFLLAAGPADFVWHSNFGLDGLLSPPHLVLISGMILSSVGALMNSAKYIAESQKSVRLLTVVSLIPVWFSVTGLFYSLSLPFSETDYFNFNPDPVFAAFFAAASYPFLISTILVLAAMLARRFGVASIVGASYIGIMSFTAIMPNHSLVHTIPFYLSNMIPIVIGDLMISKARHTKGVYLAGAVFGSASFFMYYPLITYTYNEILMHKVVWPSLTSQIYFELVPVVSPALVFAGALAGIFGVKLAQKIASK